MTLPSPAGADGATGGPQPVRILLLEDSSRDAQLIQLALSGAGIRFAALRVDSAETFSLALDEFRPDIILSDYRLLGFDGRAALDMARERCPATPMLMVTGAIGDELAVDLIKAGARDYILKDRLARLPSAVLRALAEAGETRQRQAAEKALRESEREFRSLAENSPDLILRCDRQCRHTYVNPAFERETGLAADKAVHLGPAALWPDRAAAADYGERLARVIATGEPADLVLSWPRPTDGTVVHHALRIVAERTPDGRIEGALAIGRNITALEEAKRQLEESRTQLRVLAARREAAREEERRSIARELHDELGQQLSALRFGVNLIDFQFGEAEPRIREATTRLLELVDQTIQTTRDVSASLRPAVLDMGLVPALEWLTAEFSRHTGITCDLKVPQGDLRVPEDMGVALFRIAQESLTNAARHARAGHVRVAFACDPEACTLEVQDDGAGFDAARGRKQKSFGLVGIRERALAAGGEADISSSPGQGAVVRVRIPLARQREEDS